MAWEYRDADHTYWLDGVRVPSITQMLVASGHLKTGHYTEEGRDRGTAVHRLLEDVDDGSMGLIEAANVREDYRGYLLSYLKLKKLLRFTVHRSEWAHVHPVLRFGGRLDRVVELVTGFGAGQVGPLEIKTGAKSTATGLQLAMQAMLAEGAGLYEQAERMGRWVVYPKANGKIATLEPYDDPGDFLTARGIIREQCGV